MNSSSWKVAGKPEAVGLGACMWSPASSFFSIAIIPVTLGSTKLSVSSFHQLLSNLASLSTVFTGWPTWAMHCCPFHTPAEVGSVGPVRGGTDRLHCSLGLEMGGNTSHLRSVLPSPHILELGDCKRGGSYLSISVCRMRVHAGTEPVSLESKE